MKPLFTSVFALLFFAANFAQENRNTLYITNQAPLVVQPYTALPLGTIKPKGFLLKMHPQYRQQVVPPGPQR